MVTATPESLARALERAAASLPPAARDQAARMAKRLVAPVTLAIAGEAGAEREALSTLFGPITDVAASIHDQGDSRIAAADLVLLCLSGRSTGPVDPRQLLPATCRDRTFILVTGADELARTGRIEADLAALTAVLGAEVAGLFPIAAVRAVKAWMQGDGAAFGASGGESVMTAVRQAIHHGREALCDAAALFLHRYGIEPDDTSVDTAADALAGRSLPAGAGRGGAAQETEEPAPAFDPTALPERDRIRGVLDHVAGEADHLVEMLPNRAVPQLADEVRDFALAARLLRAERSAAAAAEALMILMQLRQDVALARLTMAGDVR